MGESASISPQERKSLLRLSESIKAEIELRKGGPAAQRQQEALSTGDFVPGAQGIELGLQKEASRQAVRASIETLPPIMQFIAEMAPSTFGTIAGAFTPVPGGAAIGGFGGEVAGQEIGISPRSNLSLGLAAGGPIAGKLAGKAFKGSGTLIGKGIGSFIPARVALAKNAMRKAAAEFDSLGSKILSGQSGLMRVPAEQLYKLANNAKVRIPAFRTTKTRAAFEPLRAALHKMRAVPEVKSALALLDDVERTLKGSSISFEDLLTVKELVGGAIGQAKRAGVRTSKVKGLEKQFFKAVIQDLDHLAGLGGKTGNVAKIAKAASARAKLDFAVKDMEQGISQFTRFEDGFNTISMNVKGMREWLRKATDPRNKSYNKSMHEALKDELPGIQENLRKLTEFTATNAGGPGSLIIRGAGAAAGASAGFAVLGVPGAVAGTLIGTRLPEVMAGILSSPAALRFLMKGVNLGKGEISEKTWQIAGQIAAQAAKIQEPNRSPLMVGGGS